MPHPSVGVAPPSSIRAPPLPLSLAPPTSFPAQPLDEMLLYEQNYAQSADPIQSVCRDVITQTTEMHVNTSHL